MEALLITLLFALPLSLLAALIMAILALSKQKNLRHRVEHLESSDRGDSATQGALIQSLEARLQKLEEHFRQTPIPKADTSPAEAALIETPLPPELRATPIEEGPPTVPEPPAPAAPHHQPPVFTAPPRASSAARKQQAPLKGRGNFNIEEWVGVRGAAAAGGVILALAALLFFQYSIEHGLITPLMRVVAGIITGIGALGVSEFLIKRQQRSAANALSGAGVVILYASTWAARNLYELIGAAPASVLMIVITAVCITLAIARSSAFIAILGLAGGFATPLLVAADTAGPIALFGYLLLLDLALLWLARMKRWPLLAILCLLGTGLHQALWIARSMNSQSALLGLGVLAAFALIFLALGASQKDQEGDWLWNLTRIAALAIPFIFGLHFAATARLDIGPLELGTFLVILSAGACFLEMPFAAPAAAVASASLMGIYFLNHHLKPESAWKSVGSIVAITAVYLLAEHFKRSKTFAWAASLSGIAYLLMLIILPGSHQVSAPWPWVLGWLFLSGGILSLSRREGFSFLPIPAAILPALGLGVALAFHIRHSGAPSDGIWAALILAGPLLLSLCSLLFSGEVLPRRMHQSVVLMSVALIPATMAMAESSRLEGLTLCIGLTFLLNLLSLISATRLSSGILYLVATLGAALAHSMIYELARGNRSLGNQSWETLVFLISATLLFTFWAGIVPKAFRSTRSAWWGAALSPFLFFPVLRDAWIHLLGKDFIAVLPIILAMASLLIFSVTRKQLPEDSHGRRSSQVWYLAATLCLIALAIPLQLNREWITIGWALNALGLVLLWKHLDHPGLKYLALLLFGAVSARLLFNPAILSYHQPGAPPLFNWLSYTYLIPAAALLWAQKIMAQLEVGRQRSQELSLPGGGRPILATIYGLDAIVIIFAWINLSIAEYFSTGHEIVLSLDRMPARDLCTSVAWAIYAVILLILGVKSSSTSLRRLSLSLMLATLSKVFLHDLGSLQDLYRVASLVGLALSLILVSLIYQRFVFSNRREEPK